MAEKEIKSKPAILDVPRPRARRGLPRAFFEEFVGLCMRDIDDILATLPALLA